MSERAFTTREIAEAIGEPKRKIERWANREGWPFEEATGRGGKRRLYRPADLPREVAMRLTLEANTPAPANETLPATQEINLPAAEEVSQRQLRVAWARAGLCRAVDRLVAEAGFSVSAACRHIADDVRGGTAPESVMRLASEANDRPRAGGGVSPRGLLGWHKQFRLQGERALIPGRRQKSLSVPSWAGAFLRHYQLPTKPSVADAYRAFKRDVKHPPSIHQVRRFLAKLSPEARDRGRMGPRELRNIQPFVRRKFDKLVPNDIWTADGHTFDAEIAHPHYPNKVFRPEITTYADIRTRRIVGWSVDLAESTTAVLDGLRHGISRCGLPAVLYVDNGAGYTSNAVVDVIERLGITLTHSIPYRSQSRGAIERIQQVWTRLAKRLPSYIGADMDKEAGTRVHKITRQALTQGVAHRAIIGWDVFLQMADQAVAEYNATRHSTIKATPDAAWESFEAEGWGPETVDAEMLDTLCRPQLARKTQRGEVRLFSRIYFDNALRHHHGEEVLVGYDLRDANRVWVHELSGQLICVAEKDANAADYLPESRVEEARSRREKAQIDRLAKKIESRTGQRVASIQLEHQPGRTLDGVMGHQTLEAEPVEAERLEEARARMLAAEPEIDWATDPMSRWKQYQEWSGRDDLTDEQRRWVAHYPTTAEFRRTAEFYADFAPQKKTAQRCGNTV